MMQDPEWEWVFEGFFQWFMREERDDIEDENENEDQTTELPSEASQND